MYLVEKLTFACDFFRVVDDLIRIMIGVTELSNKLVDGGISKKRTGLHLCTAVDCDRLTKMMIKILIPFNGGNSTNPSLCIFASGIYLPNFMSLAPAVSLKAVCVVCQSLSRGTVICIDAYHCRFTSGGSLVVICLLIIKNANEAYRLYFQLERCQRGYVLMNSLFYRL